MTGFLKKIFSITNEETNDKIYKVIIILGIKFKFRNKKKELAREKEKMNENFSIIKIQLEKIQKKLHVQSDYLTILPSVCCLHQKVFPKYKKINQEKEIVLIATGPSLEKFQPIENAIYLGVNKAYKYAKIEYDYLFLQDYSGMTKDYINDFMNYNKCKTKKFLGLIDYGIGKSCIIPDKYSYYQNTERYYVAHPTQKADFTYDIATLPLGDAYSIVFPAMQFALWTHPKKIYLVGCDSNTNGHFNKKENNLAVDNVINGWKSMKEFAQTYYPDIEIISVNPVGLKGLFNDVFQGEINV